MKKSLIVLISILALLVIIIGYGISINNKMVNADEAVMSQWAKVENQYQRRGRSDPESRKYSQRVCFSRERDSRRCGKCPG